MSPTVYKVLFTQCIVYKLQQ